MDEREAVLIQGEFLLASPHVLDLYFVRLRPEVGLTSTVWIYVEDRLRPVRWRLVIINFSRNEVTESHIGMWAMGMREGGRDRSCWEPS